MNQLHHQPADPAPGPGRSATWLPLLRRLGSEVPDWMVYKGIESAFDGTGDIDSIGPGSCWDDVTEVFRTWAAEQSLGPVVVCRHVSNVLHLVALDPDSPWFFELDVNRRKVFLGSTLFVPTDMYPLAREDEEGFRVLRPGVQGLLKLVQNGARRGGRPNWEGIAAKGVVELLEADPEGVALGSELFGRGAPAARELSAAVVAGRWSHSAMLRIEGWCLLGAVREPESVMARLRFRSVRQSCPLLVEVFSGRRVPTDRERWLADIEAAGDVVHRCAPPAR